MVHFEKPIKTKKTSGKKNTIDPVFNESINFNITPQQLENTSIVVTVWDYNSKSKDDFVGRVVLGKYGSGPHEYTHWNRMLTSQRSAVAQWHSLRSRQECDQVSPASIAVPWHRMLRSRMQISNACCWQEFSIHAKIRDVIRTKWHFCTWFDNVPSTFYTLFKCKLLIFWRHSRLNLAGNTACKFRAIYSVNVMIY